MNCYWATRIVQANNSRKNVKITHLGETMTVSQWARRLGLSPCTIHQRMHSYGFTDPADILRPVIKGRKLSEATLAKLRGQKRSPESRQKMSQKRGTR